MYERISHTDIWAVLEVMDDDSEYLRSVWTNYTDAWLERSKLESLTGRPYLVVHRRLNVSALSTP